MYAASKTYGDKRKEERRDSFTYLIIFQVHVIYVR